MLFTSSYTKGVFTVIAKDTIDLNTRSSIATMDYHGTGLSLIQMHSEESEGTVYDYIYAMDNAIYLLKIDSLQEEYSQISTFLSDPAVYYALKCNDLMEISSLDSSILSEAVQQETEWLDTTVALNHGLSSDHASQK